MIKDYLEHEYGEEDDDYYERRIGEYHSSASGQCPRRRFFDWMEDSRPGPDAWPHFEIGHNIEDIVEDALTHKHDKRHVKNGIPIRLHLDDFEIVGETDLVVLGDNLVMDEMIEVKSTGNLKYARDEPKRAHVYQVHCYMKALGLPQCKVLYVDKFRLRTVEHVVEFEQDVWEDIVERTTELHDALTVGEPPDPREGEGEHNHFCDYGNRCCKNL